MSERADALANRIMEGAEALASFTEHLSPAGWATIVPGDQRPVGVLVHHVASMYPLEVDLARLLAEGKPIAGVTWDDVDQGNADHAHTNAEVAQGEAIALLRRNSKAAADRVREFTDEELDNAAIVSLNTDAPLTAQYFIEDHALQHSFHHLSSIRMALDA